MHHLAYLGALVLSAAPAAAQDVLGPVNPVDYMPAITMGAAAEASARSSGREARSRRGSDANTRRTCAKLPTYRAHYGRSNRQVTQLTRLCRKAGY
jgi:hypothetical protein